MQVVVVTSCCSPFCFEVHSHDTHLDLHTMFLIIIAQKAYDLPELIGQFQAFLLRAGARKIF